jgi:hypothetical protein
METFLSATVVWLLGYRKDFHMMRALFVPILFAAIVFPGGCSKQESDADLIREGINQHLTSLKTINLAAMNMNITKTSIEGNQANVQVEFLPKTGAPAGASMQVAYSMEKQGAKWVVQNSQPMGGMIQHPAPGENPHATTTPPSSPNSLPNFSDLVGSPSGNSIPTGHPPVSSQGNMPSQASPPYPR